MRNLNMPVDWHVSSLLINFNNNGNGFFYISGHPISDIRRFVLIPSTKLSMCILYALWVCFTCFGLPVLKLPDHWNDNNRMLVIWWIHYINRICCLQARILMPRTRTFTGFEPVFNTQKSPIDRSMDKSSDRPNVNSLSWCKPYCYVGWLITHRS